MIRSHTLALALLATSCALPVSAPPAQAPPTLVELVDDGDRGPARPSSCPASVPFVATVRAQVVDPEGAGVADARVQLCVWTHEQRMLCLEPGRAGADGMVSIEVAGPAQCMETVTARVLLPSSTRPSVYCDLSPSLEDASFTIAVPFVLLDAGTAIIPPEGAVDEVRTVDLAGGVSLEVTPSALRGDAYDRLAGAAFAVSDAPACMLAGAPSFRVLMGTSPEADIVAMSFPFSLPAPEGVVVGDALTVFVLGGLECKADDGTFFEKGHWHEVGEAVVDDDGLARGTTPCLGWIGLR